MSKAKSRTCPLCSQPAFDSFYNVDCTNAWCRNYKEAAWREFYKHDSEDATAPSLSLPDADESPFACLICGRTNCHDSNCF